jgi:phage gp45-like
MNADEARFIRQEIARQLNVILSGQAGDNSSIETETIDNLFPGSPSIADRPVMHPYGFASRAPTGTIAVTAKHGADAQNRMVLGHRDKVRKLLDLSEGDAVIYSSDGAVALASISLKGGVVEITNEAGTLQLGTDGTIGVTNDVGGITLSATGEISAKGSGGAAMKLANGQVAIGAAAGEVVDILNEVVTQLSTCTAAGFGAPISIVAAMTPLLTKLGLIKGSL